MNRQPIFRDERDRPHFLELLGKSVDRHKVWIHLDDKAPFALNEDWDFDGCASLDEYLFGTDPMSNADILAVELVWTNGAMGILYTTRSATAPYNESGNYFVCCL